MKFQNVMNRSDFYIKAEVMKVCAACSLSTTMTSLWTRWRPKITGVSIVYLTVCSGADQRKQQSSMSKAFVMGIHR